MRVLFVTRQKIGGLNRWAHLVAESLDKLGVEVVVDDASKWIPDQTGWSIDKKVSKQVKKAAQGFDLVHAWGMRSAWAASEAFYLKFPWVYTAYDMPKTTHPQLIDRLNAGRRGICASRSVKKELSMADALTLEVVTPCAGPIPEPMEKEEARRLLDLPPESPIFLSCGPPTFEAGIDSVLEPFEKVSRVHPDARLVLALTQDAPDDWGLDGRENIQVIGVQPTLAPWITACDAMVVPSRKAGFSMAAAEAMLQSRPVLMRDYEGLSEMAVNGMSAYYYDSDDEMAEKMGEIISTPDHAATIAYAGFVRADDRFDIEESARRHRDIYRDVLG